MKPLSYRICAAGASPTTSQNQRALLHYASLKMSLLRRLLYLSFSLEKTLLVDSTLQNMLRVEKRFRKYF